MDNYDFETYLEIDSEIEKLRNIANSFGKNVSADSEGDHQLSVFIDLNSISGRLSILSFLYSATNSIGHTILHFSNAETQMGFMAPFTPSDILCPNKFSISANTVTAITEFIQTDVSAMPAKK